MDNKVLIFILLFPLLTVADESQEVSEATRTANPCLYDEQFKEFDFWIGEWDVHVANGTLAGHNEITREQRGCVLIENWASASGGGGVTEEGMLLLGTIHGCRGSRVFILASACKTKSSQEDLI